MSGQGNVSDIQQTSSILSTTSNVSISTIPTEILIMIFKYLDFPTFCSVRLGCRKWKEIIDSIKDEQIWKHFVGKNYKKLVEKSNISYYNLCMRNIPSWRHLRPQYDITPMKIITMNTLIWNIHIYKDSLIVIFIDSVKYFNVDDFALQKTIEKSFVDFVETDYMTLAISYGSLSLYKKESSCNSLKMMLTNTAINNNHVYRLVENKCYYLMKPNSVWVYTWSGNRWDTQFLAKFYGEERVTDISVWQGQVYVLTSRCAIYKVVYEERRLALMYDGQLHCPCNRGPLFVNNFSIFCDVRFNVNIKVNTNISVNDETGFMISCTKVTYLLEHGDVIALGFFNGKIELHSSKQLLRRNDFDNLTKDYKLYVITTPETLPIEGVVIQDSEHTHNVFALQNGTFYKYSIKLLLQP